MIDFTRKFGIEFPLSEVVGETHFSSQGILEDVGGFFEFVFGLIPESVCSGKSVDFMIVFQVGIPTQVLSDALIFALIIIFMDVSSTTTQFETMGEFVSQGKFGKVLFECGCIVFQT